MRDLRVIDFHVHVGLKEHWKDWVKEFGTAARSEFYERYEEMIVPERFAAHLESHNIAKAAILPEINPEVTGVVPNEYVFEFCQGFDVFVPFCTINPSLTEKPGKDFEQYVRMGAKGIKLYPSYSFFYPNDSALYPIYEIAQENRLPVLVHTGSSIFKGSKIKYADPIHLDEVVTDYPELPVLMAHSGRGLWYERAFFLSKLHPNLYMEISGLPPKNLLNYFPELEKNIDKVVYGSDWPGIQSIEQNIEAIQKLPLAQDSIEKILYRNAARILDRIQTEN
ncbi:MAG: amidohydrolase family protein [Candidatus Aminicenantes bacterium]|jgi:predicted TIM-barrel fold metal-dependent hydrolase